MRPTLNLFGASRLPLTSKRANKDFYKGTRTGNVMQRKRIALADRKGRVIYDEHGRPKTWNLKLHSIDDSRLPCYVVPPGLATTELRPYVFTGKSGGSAIPLPGFPGGPKMTSHRGFDSTYYQLIREESMENRKRNEIIDRDLKEVRKLKVERKE